jgi:hypothetical protein
LAAELAALVPAELRPPHEFRAVRRWSATGPPELEPGTDFVWIAPTLPDLDLPAVDLDEAIALASKLPFLPAMRVLSALSAAVYHASERHEVQLGLARVFYGEVFGPKVEEFLIAGENRLAFDPRHIATLQRLLVAHARDDDPPEGLSRIEQSLLAGALLAAGTSTPHYDPPEPVEGQEADWAAWTRYTTQIALYYDAPWVAEAVARAWSNYVAVANDLRDHHRSCPAEQWMVEDYGVGLAAQVGAGLAYAAGSGAFDPEMTIEQRGKTRPGAGFLAQTALAEYEAAVVSAISADRAELARAFKMAGEEPLQIGWDHTAFESKPFLREPNGNLVLVSPFALVSWLTRGIHFRVLDAGRQRADPRRPQKTLSGRWLDYAGALGEESVRRLLDASMAKGRLVPTTLHGELSYAAGKGNQLSPDAAVETWPDISLLEVYSGRFSRVARSEDPEQLLDALQRGVIAKLVEVRSRARDLLSGLYCYEGSVAPPKHVWPVLVLAGDSVGISPMLWGWIRQQLPDLEEDPRIARPVIVDLDDLEPLVALVERGESFIGLIKRFLSSSLAEFPLRNWLHLELSTPGDLRPRYVREQWRDGARAGAGQLYPDSVRLAESFGDDET